MGLPSTWRGLKKHWLHEMLVMHQDRQGGCGGLLLLGLGGIEEHEGWSVRWRRRKEDLLLLLLLRERTADGVDDRLRTRRGRCVLRVQRGVRAATSADDTPGNGHGDWG